MRALIVVVAVVGCSEHKREPARGSAAAPLPAAAPKPVVSHAADRLVEPGVCVAPAAWAGKWDGGRPLDNANPFAHRGPTRVTITDKLHLSEGVGAAGYEVDLVVDGNIAHGEKTTTKKHTAIALETGERSEMTITDGAAVAACFDAQGALHLWRILDASGQGIQTTHEEDAVVLQRVPMRPVPPPPKGFRVLAEDEHPYRLALAHDDVIWSTADGTPATSAIRAVPRKGGAMRELAGGIPFVHDLVVRGDYVYYASHESVGRIALAGGKPEVLVDNVIAMNLAVDDKTLAFSDSEIVRVAPVTGGKPRTVYEADNADIPALALDGGMLYIAVRPAALEKAGFIVRVPEGGGTAARVARVTVCGEGAVPSGGALLLGTCDATIVRADEHGGGLTTIAKDVQDIASIAVSGGTVAYALGAGRGIIGAVAGGKQRTLVEGEFDPQQIAIDPAEPNVVYVLDRGIDLDNPHGRIGTGAL